MQIDIENADVLRDAIKDGTASDLTAVISYVERELRELDALPPEKIKTRPGVWLLEDEDETNEDVEAYVVTEDDKTKLLDMLTALLDEAEITLGYRQRSELDLQQIAEEEYEMRCHYEV